MDMTGTPVPTVSVLMSVYNSVAFVEEAVRSVLGQTWRDLELILVDDGSSDGTIPILERLAGEDSRIRYRARANRGIPATANEMIGLARGRYLALMDHDDVMLPGCIAREVAHLDANPGTVAVGILDRTIDGAGRITRRRMKVEYWLTATSRRIARPDLFPPKVPFLSNPGSMLRARAVAQIGGYREALRYASDNDLWWRLAEVGAIERINEVGLNYRRHERNTTVLHRETVLLYDVIVTLSAVARRFGLDDAGLIAGFKGRENFTQTAAAYRALIGRHFPVETYLLFRAVRNRIPAAVGHEDTRALLAPAYAHALSLPPTIPKLQLLRRATKSWWGGGAY